MLRRRTAALLPALVLLLVGCAGGGADVASSSSATAMLSPAAGLWAAGGGDTAAAGHGLTAGWRAAGGSAARGPAVRGPFGARPAISFPGGAPATWLQVDEPVAGQGAPLETGDTAIVQYTGHVWDGRGNPLIDSTFTRGTPAALTVGAGLGTALRGHRVGSRVVAAAPESYAYGTRPPRGVERGAELLYVVDVLGAHHKDASVEAGGGSLAGVRVTGGAPPVLSVPAGAPPAEFAVKVLARGAGRGTQAGRLVVVQYEAAVWRRRQVFDATWGADGPRTFRIGDGSMIKAWERGLVGVPVGSRVLMVVPPSYGYGAAGDPAHGITGSDTLVFVVDVIAAY
ncbi:hypothetical protein FH608_012740 [Nonomuraea phyllanthi]|uniref:peptidylprolyl isomerase n=1 Tax=Nonomuraea phyllanthi TaxID=2219224 RepID=A0A5C4WQU6_9ACTN|nr:FKBP-type peptidyl-prolyl cis-trans isomerase [Nonomuraea phyllanthi]KAB8195232.1 hypothetical protein FH608_012740 [Nonomuraea phyllanthi]